MYRGQTTVTPVPVPVRKGRAFSCRLATLLIKYCVCEMEVYRLEVRRSEEKRDLSDRREPHDGG